jgi:phospholipid/cholesterol/gamma-HCH transport system substrate-binding protein
MKIRNEVKIGLLAAISIFGAIWGYKFLKGQNFLSNDKQYHAYYEYADQLAVSSPVFIKGYEVGTVTKISFDPVAPKAIRVDFAISNDIKVPKTAKAVIVSTGILGGKAIELVIKTRCTDDCAPSESELQGETRSVLSAVIGDEDLDNTINKLSAGVGKIVDSLDAAIRNSDSKEGVAQSLQDVQLMIRNLEESTSSLNNLLSSPGSSFNRTLNNVSSITYNLKENNQHLSNIMANVDTITSDLAKAKLDETIQNANNTLTTLDRRLSEAEQTIASLNATLARLEDGEGTMGKLLKSEELYDNLNRTVQNLDFLLQDVRLNPDRYIKVSVFGKKSEQYSKPEDDPAFRSEVPAEKN